MFQLPVVAALALLQASPAAAQPTAQLLDRLDQFGAQFTSATATTTVINYISAIEQQEKESGEIFVRRSKNGKIEYLLRIAEPEPYQVALRDQTAERFFPKANRIEVWNLRQYRDIAQTLMNAGIRHHRPQPHRELPGPRRQHSPDTSSEVGGSPQAHSKNRAVPIGIQRLPDTAEIYFPGNDYRLVTYTGLKNNPKLKDSDLELPKSARREKMN